MSTADLVTCACNKCQNVLCISANHWTEVTASYATYNVPASFSQPGLEQSGHLRPGSQGSELEGCSVQPLHCNRCKDSIGVSCVDVSPDKEQHRDRCFLKLGKLTMESIVTRKVVTPVIKRNPARPEANSSAAVNHLKGHVSKPQLPTDTEAMTSQQASNPVDDDPAKLDTWKLLRLHHQDITATMNSMETLQEDLRTIKLAIDDIRIQQDEQANHASAVIENIELLTESVFKISSKAGELESLKLEVKMMQARIKRLEDEKRASQSGSGILPPATPRRESISNRMPQSANVAEGRSSATMRPGSSRHSINDFRKDRLSDRPRAASAQLDTTSLPSLGNNRYDMPPPPRTTFRNPPSHTDFRGASESAPRPKNTLHQHPSAFDQPPPSRAAVSQIHQNPATAAADSEDSTSTSDGEYTPELDPAAEELLHNRRPTSYSTTTRRTTTTHPHPHNNNNNNNSNLPLPSSPPSPPAHDPNYTSIWAPHPPTATAHQPRDAQGLLIRPNGQIDKRSLRYFRKGKKSGGGAGGGRRASSGGARRGEAMRDEEGYLLLPDGTRNMRSVRIREALKKKKTRVGRVRDGGRGVSGEFDGDGDEEEDELEGSGRAREESEDVDMEFEHGDGGGGWRRKRDGGGGGE